MSRNVKSWARMVDDVLAYVGPLGEVIDELVPGFAADAEAARHAMSHAPNAKRRSKIEPDNDLAFAAQQESLSRRYFTAEVLEWMLRVAILKQTDHDASAVAAKNENLRFALGRLADH